MTTRPTTHAASPRLRLLLDTNVFIAVEPFGGATEVNLDRAATLVRLASEQGHILLVHPATRDDLREGKDATRRKQRLAELQKYSMLEETRISQSLLERAGSSTAGSNDHRDLRLLAALEGRAATYLVSEDARLLRRARRAELGDAVLTVDDAIALLEGFQPTIPSPPPRVNLIAAYALDIEQPIFDSLREDYQDFDTWLDKVRSDSANRICMVIEEDGYYAALAILKDEHTGEYGLQSPVFKISTFKVAPSHSGAKYGELLLKTIFMIAAERSIATLYVETFSKQAQLVDFFENFGFEATEHHTERNELVLVKTLLPPLPSSSYNPLDFHIKFGPPAVRITDRAFIVPIIPKWHDQLFPDWPGRPAYTQEFLPGLEPMAENHPSGNALRKAYLCRSVTQLEPGDSLFFYRSHDLKALTALGVVESVLRSADPLEIVSFVGRRTVYRPDEISVMCRSVRGVLAILFRQDRFMDPPRYLPELQASGVVRGWPQTIVRIGEEGTQWLRQRVGE